ncbi:ABC transporter ATP-binding protein [Candidatus Babeliales bacterium]|nr:ABC transporter ATP-binding protein [Candidatus Babeliales bacterium]
MRSIRLESVSKLFHGEVVIDKLNLEIPSGKFFALLGPSGCGKTTLLRLIAGLESVDKGRIFLGDDRDITNTPIYKRTINTIFQQYALFPHLTVFENVAYGLRLRNLTEKEIEKKVLSILKTVRLSGREYRNITNLSGGQQQRVALARAIVNEPEVLLLDEPLAALDLRLREQMLIELIDLQEKFKTTFVYVTHDQSEALTVADRMAIMNADGEIEQIGTPKEIYEFPASTFVAGFVGTTNILKGILKIEEGQFIFESQNLGDFLIFSPVKKSWMVSGVECFLSLRPEKIMITKNKMEGFSNHLKGTVENIIYHGQSTKYKVRFANRKTLTVFEQNEEHFPHEYIDYDDEVNLYFQKENVVLLER